MRGDDGKGLRGPVKALRNTARMGLRTIAACHGSFGENEGRLPKLVGGQETLNADLPELTVGSYWLFAPTQRDYIRRAMPFPAPRSLSADDVYALTACILDLNDIVGSDFEALAKASIFQATSEKDRWKDAEIR